jgi:hypothetical protein
VGFILSEGFLAEQFKNKIQLKGYFYKGIRGLVFFKLLFIIMYVLSSVLCCNAFSMGDETHCYIINESNSDISIKEINGDISHSGLRDIVSGDFCSFVRDNEGDNESVSVLLTLDGLSYFANPDSQFPRENWSITFYSDLTYIFDDNFHYDGNEKTYRLKFIEE